MRRGGSAADAEPAVEGEARERAPVGDGIAGQAVDDHQIVAGAVHLRERDGAARAHGRGGRARGLSTRGVWVVR